MGRLINIESSLNPKSTTSEDITIEFPSEINLDPAKEYEIGLVNAVLWYSWNNVSTKLNTNKFVYKIPYNSSYIEKSFYIPDGAYDMYALNDYITEELASKGYCPLDASGNRILDPITGKYQNNIELRANMATLKFIWYIRPGCGYKIDTNTDLSMKLLGFNATELTQTTEAPNDGNINLDFNSLAIHCSIVSDSYVNGKQSDIIMTACPEVPPGAQIVIKPNQIIYLPLNRSDVKQINMRITDQSGILLDLSNEPVSYLLHFRERTN